MGNWISYVKPIVLNLKPLKRKIEDIEKDEELLNYDSLLNTSKRRKLKSTSQYIFKTLFEEGKDSDISVTALSQKWHLHKVYLCQSPYFHSMFDGNWKEAQENDIHIEILDNNITIDSLHLALGSFYKDELNFEASQVIPLLATAVLLQMDSIIEQCIFVMKDTINIQTVLGYHEAAKCYGIVDVEQSCKTWLLHNLLTQVSECPQILRLISHNLMTELISSPNLYVMQTEFSVYVMLKAWIFLKLHPLWEGTHDAAYLDAHKYFKNRTGDEWFLEKEGKKYVDVFASLRISYLMHHYLDVEMIHSDRILPPSWLQPAASQQWFNMLRIDQDKDNGPNNVAEEVFNKLCTRCGRILHNSNHLWRWTGYNFGLDLIMTHDNPLLKLKRNHKTENLASAVLHTRRKIMYRVSVASLNEQKQVIYTKTTGIQSVSLAKNEEIRLMMIDKDVLYPLILSANFLVVTPTNYPLVNPVDEIAKFVTNKISNRET